MHKTASHQACVKHFYPSLRSQNVFVPRQYKNLFYIIFTLYPKKQIVNSPNSHFLWEFGLSVNFSIDGSISPLLLFPA